MHQRMGRSTFIPLAFLLLAGCTNERGINHVNTDTPPAPVPVRERMMREPPLDISRLKNNTSFTARSGTATLEWVSRWQYCKPAEEGRYGFHYLSDRKTMYKGPFGLLMVYGEPDWSDARANERFIEITLKAGNLALWDSVRVGMRKDELLRMLGNDGWSRDGTSYFKTLGGYGSEFIVIDSVVTQVRVGMYCAE